MSGVGVRFTMVSENEVIAGLCFLFFEKICVS